MLSIQLQISTASRKSKVKSQNQYSTSLAKIWNGLFIYALVPTPEETAEQEAQRAKIQAKIAAEEAKRAEKEARKAERLAAKLRELNIDPDTI